MTSKSDPLSLIEHELYVENAVWILHTLSTRECSSNERLGPRGGGGVLLYFHTNVGFGHFLGSKFRISIFFCFQKMNVYWGMKNILGIA